MASSKNTFAFLVGIERYDAAPNWGLDGPANDVLKMAQWLRASGVPKDRIRVLMSTLDRNEGIRTEIQILLGAAPGPTRSEDLTRELKSLQNVSADLFLFYWGGHGWTNPAGHRCLFYTDATLRAYEHLDFHSLLNSMHTDWYRGLTKQTFIVDACANHAIQPGSSPPRYEFGGGKPLVNIDQFVLYASRPGEATKNLDMKQTGLYSHELFAQLGDPRKDTDPWPPSFPAISAALKARFEELKKSGQVSQTPAQFWFRDTATGEEDVYNTSPLPELQDLLTRVAEANAARKEKNLAIARTWYVRSLRNVPTAMDSERDPSQLSIAEMADALDDWQQQSTGDLPLLTFAEGWASQVGAQSLWQSVKDLTTARAQQKGMSPLEIQQARAYLKEELRRVPDALQIFLVPERRDLQADASEMTFETSLYLWVGATAAGEGGSRVLYGRSSGQTLEAAAQYVSQRLMTDLAASPPRFIEFFVPYRLMCGDFDCWPFKRDDTMPFPGRLGTEFQVVIRSYERTLKAGLCTHFRERWPLGSAARPASGGKVTIRWLEDLNQSEEQVYNMLRLGDRAPCVVIATPTDANAHKLWRASVWAGVSIGLWLRSGSENPKDPRAHLSALLMEATSQRASALETATHETAPNLSQGPEQLPLEAALNLPKRVLQARRDSPALYPCLTLCWDDPNRLPETGSQVSPGND